MVLSKEEWNQEVDKFLSKLSKLMEAPENVVYYGDNVVNSINLTDREIELTCDGGFRYSLDYDYVGNFRTEDVMTSNRLRVLTTFSTKVCLKVDWETL